MAIVRLNSLRKKKILWGLVPFWAGGGKEDSLLKNYHRGLDSGTDLASKEFW